MYQPIPAVRLVALIAAYKISEDQKWKETPTLFLAFVEQERQAGWDRECAARGEERTPVDPRWNWGNWGEDKVIGRTMDELNGTIDMAGLVGQLQRSNFTDFISIGGTIRLGDRIIFGRIDRPARDQVVSPTFLIPFMSSDEQENYTHPFDDAPKGTTNTIQEDGSIQIQHPTLGSSGLTTTVDDPRSKLPGGTVLSASHGATSTVDIQADSVLPLHVWTPPSPAVKVTSAWGLIHALAIAAHWLEKAGYATEHWIVGEWHKLHHSANTAGSVTK